VVSLDPKLKDILLLHWKEAGDSLELFFALIHCFGGGGVDENGFQLSRRLMYYLIVCLLI